MEVLLRLIDFFAQNPLVAFLNFLIAILGLVLAIVFYYRGKKGKSPLYVVRTSNILSGLTKTVKLLEIRYSNRPIESLSFTRLAFWNGGAETIEKTDAPVSEPISVNLAEGCEILDATIIHTSNPANNFRIEVPDPRRAVLSFDYADKNDVAVVSILHTGTGGKDVTVRGTVKGVGRIKNAFGTRHFARGSGLPQWQRYLAGIGIILLGLILAVALIPRVLEFSWSSALSIGMALFFGFVAIDIAIGFFRAKMPIDPDSL
jgi:hypothetical protein